MRTHIALNSVFASSDFARFIHYPPYFWGKKTFFACFCMGKEGRDYPPTYSSFWCLRFFAMVFARSLVGFLLCGINRDPFVSDLQAIRDTFVSFGIDV